MTQIVEFDSVSTSFLKKKDSVSTSLRRRRKTRATTGHGEEEVEELQVDGGAEEAAETGHGVHLPVMRPLRRRRVPHRPQGQVRRGLVPHLPGELWHQPNMNSLFHLKKRKNFTSNIELVNFRKPLVQQ